MILLLGQLLLYGVLCGASFRRAGCYDGKGFDYIGSVNVTNRGEHCVRWNDPNLFNGERTVYQQFIVEHLQALDGYADHAYCRNPTVTPFAKPFCFTQLNERLPKFGECPIPHCEDYYANELITFYCYKGKGVNYRGQVSVTTTGKKCMHWNNQLMFIKDDPLRQKHVVKLYEMEGWISHSACRNPDPEYRTKPWCYLDMDYKNGKDLRWEYCPLPLCNRVCVETPFVCRNGGKCASDHFDFRCECAPEFTGRLCETLIDEEHKPVIEPTMSSSRPGPLTRPPWTPRTAPWTRRTPWTPRIPWTSKHTERPTFPHPKKTTRKTKPAPEGPKTTPRWTTTSKLAQPIPITPRIDWKRTTTRYETTKPKNFWEKLTVWHYAVGSLGILLVILFIIGTVIIRDPRVSSPSPCEEGS